ncbi:WSC domain-containing protein [Mycena crocata]|nr:WSC domain-containing protein [Mycena crocata]
MKCSGKATDICGGGNRISVYKYSLNTPAPTLSWSYLGCYPDANSQRTLNNGISFSSQSLTVESCQSACGAAGYKYAGVEYSQECWCASSITAGVSTTNSGCNMACTGAAGQICGGGNRISIYLATNASRRRRLRPPQIGGN